MKNDKEFWSSLRCGPSVEKKTQKTFPLSRDTLWRFPKAVEQINEQSDFQKCGMEDNCGNKI